MATIYVEPTEQGAANGSTWADCLGWTGLRTFIQSSASAGDIIYVFKGVYTFITGISSTIDGTPASPIKLIGVETTGGTPTEASGTNRPNFAMGSKNFIVDNHWKIKNLITTSSHTQGFRADQCVIQNCFIHANSNTSGRPALYMGSHTMAIDNEIICTNGNGIDGNNVAYCGGHGNYFRNCAVGFSLRDGGYAGFNIFTNCNVGLNLGSYIGGKSINNTFHECGIGIRLQTSAPSIIVNNVFQSCTTNAIWNSGTNNSLHIDYNNYWGNTEDVTNTTKGSNATNYDTQFTDPTGSNGDFSLLSGSSAIDGAFNIRLGV